MIKRPTAEDERELNRVVSNEATEVMVRGKTYKVRYMHNKTLMKMTEVMLSKGDESKVTSKCAALIVLNGMFKITFFYWFLWRWFYYVRQYYDAELEPIISEGKKKVPAESYLINTILLTGMKDTVMAMTREEAERFRQELSSGLHTQ